LNKLATKEIVAATGGCDYLWRKNEIEQYRSQIH